MRGALQKYLTSRAVGAPWRIEGCAEADFTGCVVIPALAESERLFATLDSLAANPAPLLERFLILVVVNHRDDAAKPEKDDNRRTLERLRAGHPPCRLGFVDAATDGTELPAKTGGVGLARKIGLDLALPRLADGGILACLDADTRVQANYLEALVAHFAQTGAGGAVIPFRHQEAANREQQRAITLYELFLRHYVLGLGYARSPYAFHTVGSAMACSAAAYVRMGGMNSRSAGEDFYFLQHLHKTSGVKELCGSTVFPSARSSHRVPFGTGKSVSQILARGESWQTFYRVECFRILREWLLLVQEHHALSGAEIIRRSGGIDDELACHLEELGFAQVWERLAGNARDGRALVGAFHGWFDALKTVRLIHRLCARFPRVAALEAVPQLLALHGVTAADTEEELLELLRAIQNGAPTGHSN